MENVTKNTGGVSGNVEGNLHVNINTLELNKTDTDRCCKKEIVVKNNEGKILKL